MQTGTVVIWKSAKSRAKRVVVRAEPDRALVAWNDSSSHRRARWLPVTDLEETGESVDMDLPERVAFWRNEAESARARYRRLVYALAGCGALILVAGLVRAVLS